MPGLGCHIKLYLFQSSRHGYTDRHENISLIFIYHENDFETSSNSQVNQREYKITSFKYT